MRRPSGSHTSTPALSSSVTPKFSHSADKTCVCVDIYNAIGRSPWNLILSSWSAIFRSGARARAAQSKSRETRYFYRPRQTGGVLYGKVYIEAASGRDTLYEWGIKDDKRVSDNA